jgi:small subunit ribosomal protein S20
MASHESALKAHRQSQKRRLRNRVHRSRLRTQVKKLKKAIAASQTETAAALQRPTVVLLDRSVKHGVLHRNAAARAKSRLARALRKLAPAKKSA